MLTLITSGAKEASVTTGPVFFGIAGRSDIAVEQTEENQGEECGFIGHFHGGTKASIPAFTQEGISVASLSTGRLKILKVENIILRCTAKKIMK